MKKVLMQFAGNLLSKEQMKVVKGGGDTYGGSYSGESNGSSSGAAFCVRFDTSDGCGSTTVNFSGTQAQAVSYADHQVGTSGNYGYNITYGKC
ncbi:hypothetical protein [Spirosoma linguale]|uniref:hypothetical protein n=1 Tax=Spirosoma linguale TaxID=108 RepID=UPI003CC807CD